jgi:hypothetical protein
VRYWIVHRDQENEARGTGNVAEKEWKNDTKNKSWFCYFCAMKGLATERLERGGGKQREKEKWRTRSTVIHIHCGCSLRVCVDGQTGERERGVDRYCCVVSCRVCVKGTNVLCQVTLFLVVYRQLVPFFVVNLWKRKMMLW